MSGNSSHLGTSQYTAEEIAAKGRAIYESRLRTQLERDNVGRFLVIDIETGEYEIGDDDLETSLRAQGKNPSGVRFGMRIGHRSSGSIGGKRQRAA
jgi:hypothetical protein